MKITPCDDPTWRKEKNGDRTCSYCGSLHPDDMIDIMYGYIEGKEGYEFEPSDKGYKIYAKRAGVKNAMEGGIKFYTNHITDQVRDAFNAAWQLIVPVYRHRMEERWGKGCVG